MFWANLCPPNGLRVKSDSRRPLCTISRVSISPDFALAWSGLSEKVRWANFFTAASSWK